MTQQIGRDVDRVIIVSRYTIFPGPDDLDAIPAPQAAHAPLPNAQPRGRATFHSCVVARSFAGLSGAVHGYELASPYHRVDTGSSAEPATRRKYAV